MAADMKRTMLEDIAKRPLIKLESVEQGCRGHIKLFLDTPAGKKILVVSISASDVRAIQNNKSILRRWERGVA